MKLWEEGLKFEKQSQFEKAAENFLKAGKIELKKGNDRYYTKTLKSKFVEL